MQNIKSKFKYLFSHFFTPREVIFTTLLIFASIFFLIIFLYKASTYLMTERILYSGSLTEGIIESPKNTNPYKSDSQVDSDISKLLFSSLIANVSGDNFDTKLAEKIDVSSDKITYRVTLNDKIYFSNGNPITIDDILYSLDFVPLEKNYTVEKTAENVLTFTLKGTNKNNFLETLTYPIIAKDEQFDTNFSKSLITSSSFKIKDLEKDADGNLTKLVLQRYNNGEKKLPYLKNYTIIFYSDEESAYSAFQKKEIDLLSGVRGSTISKIKDDTNIKFEVASLPNNFAIFINQNSNEVLRDADLRQAMSDVIDRSNLINQVLGSFGIPEKNILGENTKPVPPEEIIKNLSSSFSYENGVLYSGTKKKKTDTKSNDDSESNASERNEVKVSLTTIENPELIETAKFIALSWKKIGIQTDIKIISRQDLNTVVKDRDFENLLFGFSIKKHQDYYSFFSSKERTYPKLNISNYTSISADKVLDTLVNETDPVKTKNLLEKLSKEISSDNPVIILYKPQFVFAHFQKIHITLPNVIKSEDARYTYINDWYTNTEKVLSIWKNISFINKLDTLLY